MYIAVLQFIKPNASSYVQRFLINSRKNTFESFAIINALRPQLTPGTNWKCYSWR